MRALLTSLLLLAATPALAQEAPVHIGDWLVGPADAESCQMQTHFADHYLIDISEDAGGTGKFVFADDRLMLKDGDVKPATYSWDGWQTSHEGDFNVVVSPGGKSYLVMETTSRFTEEMTGSKALSLRIPGIDFDNEFAIPNSGDLTKALVRCNASH